MRAARGRPARVPKVRRQHVLLPQYNAITPGVPEVHVACGRTMTGDQNVLGGGGSSLLGGGGGLNLGGLGGGQPQQFGGAGTSLLGGGTSALGGLGGAPIGGGGGMLMGGMVGGLAQQQQQQQQAGGLSAKQPQTEAEKIEALMPLIVKLTDADQVSLRLLPVGVCCGGALI